MCIPFNQIFRMSGESGDVYLISRAVAEDHPGVKVFTGYDVLQFFQADSGCVVFPEGPEAIQRPFTGLIEQVVVCSIQALSGNRVAVMDIFIKSP